MKLRTRLLVSIGTLFFFAFTVSLLYETYITKKKVGQTEEKLRGEIVAIDEREREHIENYLHVVLVEDLARIDSLLVRIARDPELGAKLFIDPPNLTISAPAHSAFLFKDDRFLDFIQTTREGQLTSLMIPVDFPMDIAHEVEIDPEFSWIIFNTDRDFERPLIGVRLLSKPPDEQIISMLVDEMIEAEWGLMVLFDPKALRQFIPTPIESRGIFYGVDLVRLIDSIEKASNFLKESEGNPGWIKKDILRRSKGDFFSEKPLDREIRCLEEEGEVLNRHIIQRLERGDQAVMISALASLFPSGEFGDSIFSSMSPKGIARFPRLYNTGHFLMTDQVFYKSALFDAGSYLKKYPSKEACDDVGSSIAVIAPSGTTRAGTNRVFVGNSLEITGKTGSGSLTLAIDADQVLQDLILPIGKSAFLVHQGRVVSAFTEKGVFLSDPGKKIPFTPEMLQEKNGIFEIEGRNFYYRQLVPFDDLDLHFFIFEPEDEAFALLNFVREGTEDLITSVSLNLRLASVLGVILVLFVLHRIALSITGPIAHLASVTSRVAAGKLEGIELPIVSQKRHDEVATLCGSFEQMVTDIKEKEKVKGVLNKVVSPEIAKEITKGTIHLGGEERKVTVFFADIRNFTQMSSLLSPHEVVDLLNTCMTTISHVVDECGGVIDKYVGDEVMALFGAPIDKEESALQAIRCGLKTLDALKKWNQKRKEKGLPSVDLGIGIHTGVVLVGNMGAENRLNYTVIGSNVNLASRLCSQAKGGEILITKDTLDELGVAEKAEVEETGPIQIKGFEKPIVLYRVKGVR